MKGRKWNYTVYVEYYDDSKLAKETWTISAPGPNAAAMIAGMRVQKGGIPLAKIARIRVYTIDEENSRLDLQRRMALEDVREDEVHP